MDRPVCPGCAVTMPLTPAQQSALITGFIRRGYALCPTPQLIERIRRCDACEALESHSTCRHCGCLVFVRASLLKERCPHPSGNRWDEGRDDGGADEADHDGAPPHTPPRA